jgi:hypothetical protein
MKLVPLPSERCTTMIFWSGNLTPGLSLAMRRHSSGDLAQVDVGQHVAAELDVADAGNVEDGHHRAQHGGNVNQLDLGAASCSSVIGSRRRRQSRRARGDLADAAARADGLVVDLDAGMRRAVLAEPLGIDRIGEGCARPGQLLRLSRAQGQQSTIQSNQRLFHGSSPLQIYLPREFELREEFPFYLNCPTLYTGNVTGV